MLSRFIVYRPAWRLTWLSRLIGLVVLAAAGWGGLHGIYPFLGTNQPLATNVLVVEGWMPDTALGEILDQVRSGKYAKVYLTGGPIGQNDPNSQYGTFPEVMKLALQKRGVPEELLIAVPSPAVVRDRTYASALALRRWLNAHGIDCPTFNLMTAGPHSRRSRLLFGKAFGYGTQIGVISVEPDDYDSSVWWRTSSGFREVIAETIAYVYARFFFHG